jgi:hypothetical protein
MMMRFSLVAMMAALVASQPVSAADPSPSTAAASSPAATSDKKADKPKEKKICHREVPTGSITPVRVCRTQAEIDTETTQGQAQLDDMRRAMMRGDAR